ncbi:MAG: PEGA domain-containing protein [Gammaproteobacteria bacterium]|nr:PEGA domain-containing protein [Gammaproteobacteria bacterium]
MTPPEVGGAVAHPDALPPGTRVERYAVGAVLSASDASIRYSCRDGDNRWALLECFPTALVRRQDGNLVPHTPNSATAFATMLEEFLRDADNAMSFRHAGIAPLHRTLRANGTVYAIMASVEGETLASLLARDGPLPADRLEPVANGLLATLGAMHGASLLHLGVDPGEIVVTGEDRPVVLASTLVRRSAGGARHAFAEIRQQRHAAFVTSPYTALELYAKGGQIGPWTDLYSLAATLYRCVTGEVPVTALERVLQDDLPELSLEADYDSYSRGTLAAVDAALRLQPDERPRSVDGWRIIEQRGAGVPVRPGRVGPRAGGSRADSGVGRQRWALAALGLMVVTAVISYVDTGLLRDGDSSPDTEVIAAASESPAAGARDAAMPEAGSDVPERAAMPEVPPEDFTGMADETREEGDLALEETGDARAPGGLADGAAARHDTLADVAETPDEDVEDSIESPEPAPAALVVETVPAGVEVWLAGQRVGRTPLQIEGLVPGVRDIALRHPLYETINLSKQNFAAGRQVQIERRLARATGSLRVTTDPPGAWVSWRDERIAESTPATLTSLPAGPIELTIGAPGYRSETVAAEIPRGSAGELERSLERALGRLTLELSPADATATVLGEDGGGYSAGMTLPEGSHLVEVLHPGYEPRTTTVTIAGETRVAIDLQRLRPCGLRVSGMPPAARYPFARTFGGARRNLGSASILVEFTVQADGAVAGDDVTINADRSSLDDPRNLEAFSDAAIEAVRRYRFDFEEGVCDRRQRASLMIRFLAPEGDR